MRRLLAVFLILHGLAHLAGTSDSLARASSGRSVEYLAGAWTVSDPMVLRVLGVLWAILALGFVMSGIATWRSARAWPRLLWSVALASSIAVALALWASVIGLVIDIVLLAIARAALRRRPAERLA